MWCARTSRFWGLCWMAMAEIHLSNCLRLAIKHSCQSVWPSLHPSNRLVQGLPLSGRLGGEWRLLQWRWAPELWPRGRFGEEAGELWKFVTQLRCVVGLHLPHCCLSSSAAGSWEVHSCGRLREGGTSGAVRQERRRCSANQRGGGGAVVSSFIILSSVWCLNVGVGNFLVQPLWSVKGKKTGQFIFMYFIWNGSKNPEQIEEMRQFLIYLVFDLIKLL